VNSLVGIDVGGTFTDLVLIERSTGAVRVAKVPTTIENQAVGVLTAIERAGAAAHDLDGIVHGTTAATNALLERKGARVGLITTRGFRDVLELGRRTRPTAYGLKGSFEPLIPRDLRFEVDERIDAEGEIVTPLDEDDVRVAARSLLALGAEVLVIHFIHSYLNDRHERRAREIAAAEWPNRFITVGSELLPEYREYERGTTAAINGFVQPVIDRYLRRLAGQLATGGFRRDLVVMQGNGGTMTVDVAARQAVATLMSGPAAGVMAAAHLAQAAGHRHVISCDMGGTSFDVGVIRDGRPAVTSEKQMGYGLPVRIPMIDIHTIGAGGGSLARLDAAGILRVGPESAGAEPGPVCFGRGGDRPTIADANLLLGRLNPEGLLGVEGPARLDLVRDAFTRTIATPLGFTPEEAASAMIRIANDKMAGAIRLMSVERGDDPRDFVLFAFGGAGPLHGTALARALGIPTVLVPARPGMTSALGCLVADVRHDFVNTVNRDLEALDMGRARAILVSHADQGHRLLEGRAAEIERVTIRHEADMQFRGQTHVLTVPVGSPEVARDDLRRAFEQAYWARFEVDLPEMRAQLVSLRTTVIGHRRPVSLEGFAPPARHGGPEARRPVWFDEGWMETPVYRRESLPAGAELEGPAIIEQLDTTTVLEPPDRLRVDALGNLEIRVRPLDGAAGC
jgi:N-methylhydantoinase A